MTLPSFRPAHIQEFARLLAGAASHSELTHLFKMHGFAEPPASSKADRIRGALSERQVQDKCGNNVGAFLEAVLDPARFVNASLAHDDLLYKVNQVLAFSGLQIGKNGRLQQVTAATTVSEAQERASTLRTGLSHRRVHPDVLAFCRPELLQQNYFHAVLEATKSVAEKLRTRTKLTTDGAELIDAAVGGAHPKLAINSLQSDSERPEQKGFANLLKGLFGTFRNVTAHAPKVTLAY